MVVLAGVNPVIIDHNELSTKRIKIQYSDFFVSHPKLGGNSVTSDGSEYW